MLVQVARSGKWTPVDILSTNHDSEDDSEYVSIEFPQEEKMAMEENRAGFKPE